MTNSTPSSLPSLNALKVFEAVARHRSMTRAARELCVTHGAVSRQIRALESKLGVLLLKRHTRSVEPTPEGIRLAADLAIALNLMQAAVERTKPGPLVLSCSSSITMCWLIPRMQMFYEKNPGIDINLDMNYGQVDFMRDNISVAIRSSAIEKPRNALISDLGPEWIGAVCSPAYLMSSGLNDLSDLSRVSLLATRTRPNAWRDWLEVTTSPQKFDGLAAERTFEHFYLMIQAAACDLGVAIAPYMLVSDELRSGRLIAPFGFIRGRRRLSLWIAPHMGENTGIKILESWLTQEMKDCPPPFLHGCLGKV